VLPGRTALPMLLMISFIQKIGRRVFLLVGADGGGDGATERLVVLGEVERIAGKLFGEVLEQLLSESILFFAARGKCQKDLREGFQVAAAIHSLLYFLHAELFIAMNAAEPEHKACGTGQRADDVIGAAQGDIGVVGIGTLLEEHFSVGIRFFQVLQRVVVFLQEHAAGVGLHAGGQREYIKTFRIARMLLEALKSQRAGLDDGGFKALHAAGIRSAYNASEEALVIEEIVAGEDVLKIELLEDIAGGNGDLSERLVGMIAGPFLKDVAGFRKLLYV